MTEPKRFPTNCPECGTHRIDLYIDGGLSKACGYEWRTNYSMTEPKEPAQDMRRYSVAATEYEALQKRIAELEVERDRLREEVLKDAESIAVTVLNAVAGSGCTTPADAASRILRGIRALREGGTT